MNTVTVYDIQNKFIAYSAPMPEVVDVVCEWGSIYVLAGDRKVSAKMSSRSIGKKLIGRLFNGRSFMLDQNI